MSTPRHPGHDDDWMPKVRTPENDPSLRIPETLSAPVTERPDKPRSMTSGIMEMGKAWGVALDFIFTIVAGAAAGWGFDYWWGTTPTGSLIGFGAGFTLALIRIIRYTLRQERLEREARDSKTQNSK